ncbi:unnamed protein product [Allacma fusca]|uniref:PID domain-containing protein n=1 Tax=Allacma fusca TaxID=39272 RepID=A0A8J2LG00_9HEXA|nr:unnamed protein product [Allacma fusca]
MSEMKKSSYYVLFLGAKESKGLRGQNYIDPVLQYMVSQEHRMQALKVTLQVSSKGLKIIPCNQRLVSAEAQTERHFIPHHAITCVIQAPPPNDDIVSCILLIYNPDTKCPVHVHCYRCDSPETASVLKQQLETLVNREDNQRKFRDIESRLQSKGLLPSCHSPTKRDRGTPEFDCRTSDSSENSDRGFGSGSGTSNLTSDRIATLYDSLAAELREKLSARKRNAPILLPPRDYDTMHRQRGNFNGIDSRRCSNPAVVGGASGLQRNRRSYASREQESCGRSSGIGSAEDNCSPIHDTLHDNHAVPSSSDDEDWNPSQLIATESSQFLVRPTWPSSSPPPRSSASPIPPPLPKRPELRQRSPDISNALPLPIFSRERFEGVRQKWEKVDSQYVRQRSHDSLDEGYRSREAAEADYRRQLSRESLLRSLSRSKTGSRDSLDRWVENGVRSRSMWRNEEVEGHGKSVSTSRDNHHLPQPQPQQNHHLYATPLSADKRDKQGKAKPLHENHHMSRDKPSKPPTTCPSSGNISRLDPKKCREKSYRELDETERFPGLDKDTARVTLHSSNLNLSQHIYSEPSFETSSANTSTTPSKSKRFSFAFWK